MLDPNAQYKVHFESVKTDKLLTGETLADGIVLTLATAPAAELIIYERAD